MELTAFAILSFQLLLLLLLANLVYYILRSEENMLRDKIKDILVGLVLAMLPMVVSAQPRYIGEIGLRGGVAFYNGDINSSKVFRDLSPAAGAFLRFKANDFLNFKIDGGFANLKCDARDYPENAMPEVPQDGSGIYAFEFDKRIMTFDALIIWNFFKYGFSSYDKDIKRHTPYAMLGPTMSMSREWSGNEFRGGIAFGAGYKFKVSQRVNIGVEFTMHKLFSDDLDVGEYDDYTDDPYKMGKVKYKNNDYYSLLMGYISVDVFRKRGSCRYLGR